MDLALLGALHDALGCTFEELCPITVQAVPNRATGTVDVSAKKDAWEEQIPLPWMLRSNWTMV